MHTSLQNLISSEGEAELGRGSHDTSRSALEERLEALFPPNCLCAVSEPIVGHITFSRFDLQPSLDDIAGCG
jgi:hypothetical protein